ncbi:regulatory P domain-containing protein [Halovivax gelatinilyticus]|uniref:regulatory P domain-containing protein n=1 Tax=Halovivax gelatinilyticus TaxID=2961597 RepID=UPI0020CA73B2|nr:regulatory P domain-containing protein [Halovivax gelatinilyticus]
MNRRRVLSGTAGALSLALAGCTGGDDANDDGDTGDDGGSTPSPDRPDHARSGEGVAGRIDPLGHATGSSDAFYTYGAISPDGEWGVLGGFPTDRSDIASTLVDLDDLEEPAIAHGLETADPATRTNAVEFDAHEDGLYYRSQEGSIEGIEVVDFGWRDGSPEEPEIVASLETPNTGVHRLTTHPTEPVIYLVDHVSNTDTGVFTVDVSSPDAPEIVDQVGPTGGCHDVEYDPVRDVVHAAYIHGAAEGYVIYDASDPYDLQVLGQFEYDDQPDYTALGEPGFEHCHQAGYDPERDLAVIGDETQTGMPGGKHVFDIGWDEGSLEDPQPIGFTHSPDAREMATNESFWWTTHFHDVVPRGDETLLVDGGYRQGAWVCNLTDPREPTPTERIATVSGASDLSGDADNSIGIASPPFAWGATYNEARDVVFVSDSLTGAYTLSLSDDEARGAEGRGPDGHYDSEAVQEDDLETVANGEHGF